jgi:hypothetical protein
VTGHLLLDVGNRRLAVPIRHVEALVPWEAPVELPHGQPWLAGLFPRRGEAVPVLDPSRALGTAEAFPEVLLLLRLDGRPLAVPGRGPRRSKGPFGEGEPPVGADTGRRAEVPGGEAEEVDVEALYSACGLR